ncbi:class IV adenylate cyclase [Calycomorphotria hydatis]|uniref:CYTH domain protein n=1 Tax=Calycomorphotria hydatis TaxID=2528027 RepID=A0A517TCK5_9PLAN|nr:class IV adenylate cyclase [Calycomorphotria hydatis]QDT66098.1 CYTH domain protein [Calycomorphotria hydatis]
MSYEVESKFPVADLATLREKLEALGAEVTGTHKQADTYFAHPSRNFAETDEAFRVRRVDSSSVVTYKGPRLEGETKARFEAEVPLATDAAQTRRFEEILMRLGFDAVRIVRKERTSLNLKQGSQQFILALDEVTGLGSFLEIELTTDEAGLDAARKDVSNLASKLGLPSPEPRSYLEMLLELGPEADDHHH